MNPLVNDRQQTCRGCSLLELVRLAIEQGFRSKLNAYLRFILMAIRCTVGAQAKLIRWTVVIVAAHLAQPVLAQTNDCEGMRGFGPYDYRYDKAPLHLVEKFHFTPEVEALIGGHSGRLGGDLDYTLRAFPNHHRALLALVRYAAKTNSSQPPDMRPVECYFNRAIRLMPTDPLVRIIFAKYLSDRHRADDAKRELVVASKLGVDDPLTQQSIGLAYVELKDFDEARAAAVRAIALGRRPKPLIQELIKLGQWAEVADSSGTAASAPGQ